MRITILVNVFLPKWIGGTEIATEYVAEHLAKRGHEVHIITSLDEGMSGHSSGKGYVIHRIPRVRTRIVGEFFYWVAMARKIRQINPDIVHAQCLHMGIPALIAKKLLNIPYAVWAQGSDVYLPDWFIKLASKTIIKNANSAIAQSNDMKRVMQAIYPREIAVVPMGIELEEYKDRCSEKGRETPQKRIIFVGRFDPVKGLDNLLRAMNSVGKVLPDAQLILVGDGKERKNLESLADSLGIRDSVDFTGRLNGEKKTEYLCQADLFVLPSISEGFGIVILEAMACGLPVVATRVGGVPDLVEDGVNGYLVESRDFQEMAKKIILLLQNPTLHHQIATNNRKKVQGYAWENIISQLERIYLEIS